MGESPGVGVKSNLPMGLRKIQDRMATPSLARHCDEDIE